MAPEEQCLGEETIAQRQLLASYNQLADTGRNFGVKIPYADRKDDITDAKRPGSIKKSATHPFCGWLIRLSTRLADLIT